MKIAQTIAGIVFGLLFLVKGIIPAFQTVGMDFANYYTSSYVLIHDRENIDRLYDKAWFAERARSLGSPEGGIFQPFPPPTALLFSPLVFLDLKTAKALWTVVNMGLLALLVIVLSRLSTISIPEAILIVLASGFALINNFYLGQTYLLMTVCLALSIFFLNQKRDILAGIFAGVFIPIKYFPLCLMLLFLYQRRWSAVWSALATAGAVLLVSLLWMGPGIHETFIRSILLPHLDGELTNPFSATYQSWNSLLRSLFVRDAWFNPRPFVDSSLTFSIARAIIFITPTVLFFWHMAGQRSSGHKSSLVVAALFALVLLLAPATATYHFLVLTIPLAMLYSDLSMGSQMTTLTLMLFLYVGVGIVPAGAMERLGLSGLWKVLEYPRLYLLSGFFVVSLLAMNTSLQQMSVSTQEELQP